jgi:hypothetical protein
LGTLGDKILRRALTFTIVPNLFEMNAVYTAVGERLFIKLLLLLLLLLLHLVYEDLDP